MSNLAFRFLTALVGLPIILGLLYLGPPLAWFVLAGAAMTVASLEFYGMTHPGDRFGQAVGTAFSVAIFSVLVGTDFGTTHPAWVVAALLALAPAALLVGLLRPDEIPTALPRTSALVLGPLYVGGSMAALATLRTIGTSHEGAGLAVLALMVAWLSDTFGYFFGKGLKGPKLYAAVSPNKTWAGGVGGVLGSMLGAVIAHFVYLKTLPLVPGLVLAAVAGVYGQIGDFAESVLKRSAGVKDSGGILPGHGGILDRVDALMFAAAAMYVAFRAGLIALDVG